MALARCLLRMSRSACRMCCSTSAPKLRQMDPCVYEAALDLGCNPGRRFFKVVLPEIMPAIISAFLISLTYSIDDFIISYFNSGTVQTLPIAIYSMTKKKRVSPGDKRAFRHHVCGDFNHHPRGQRRGFRARLRTGRAQQRRAGDEAYPEGKKTPPRLFCAAACLAAPCAPAFAEVDA